MQSSNHIAHVAPKPDSYPRGDAMAHARMQKSSIQMFPDARDKDTFTSPAKRSNAAQNQFSTSIQLYGGQPQRSAQKKMTTTKIAEINGSNTVKPLNF